MKYFTKFAFSLIELLVVITIIGVIAAVAVPLYQSYQIKAKIADAITIANASNTQAKMSLAQNGVFPTFADSAPYINSPYIFGNFGSPLEPHTCKAGVVYTYINNYVSGPNVFQSGQGRGIIYINYLIESPSGTVQTFCQYYENVDSNLAADPGLIPNCVYGVDEIPAVVAGLDAC